MIILDTNVASELGKPNPYPTVAAWFARQSLRELYLTSVTEAEMLYGIERMPDGRRRNEVVVGDDRVINEVLNGRILSFDRAAARAYAEIRIARERAGRDIETKDCMIAAIARVNGAAVATRNVSDFDGCGVEVVNPWMV